MKKLILLLLFPVFLTAQSNTNYDSGYDWLTSYDMAMKKAKKNDKNILMFFTGSDWCPPCVALKKDLLDTPKFKSYADEYILLYVDIPRNKDLLSATQLADNKKLASKYNKRGSVPMMKIVNEKGNELGAMSGYSMNGEIQYHTKFLSKYTK
ncbi:thioredoxin family protein [Cellulophaga baltica]|uniref:thioredoxin family protein n=1 Tax=Cellulophaga TaxID=104264 RepID=UPI001C066B93|nr:MULTISPECIES: thioredoxin family protein [Cellulophaga]MBU2996128.1 thioredoxin family protein [Cellulophaga baltica]MDO6767523.1 thioredoxin family protein [Cellulophaga sp. 1_MG-2023]